MKINLKIWVGVILLSALVIAFRNFDFPSGKKYLVNRMFRETNAKHVPNQFIEGGLDISTLYSDSIIAAFSQRSLNDSMNDCNIRYYDIGSFNALDSFGFQLAKTAQLKYCTRNRVYYIDRFGLYGYNPESQVHEKLTAENLKCLNILQVNANTLILFAEEANGSKYTTGYYTIDLDTKKISLSKLLEDNEVSHAPNNSLIYSGKFKRVDQNSVIYYCDKYSKVYFFDNEGRFVKEFTTADQAPKPQLVSDKHAFYYKRGNTFNVNNSIHVENDKLLAFSCRSEPVKYMIIDIYSLETGKYLSSTKLQYKDWNCPDIISVSKSGRNAIINFQDGVAMFDLAGLGL